MYRLVNLRPWFGIVALLSGFVLAREPGPHVHGAASLQIATDGNALALSFESPLDNLLGFEHLPRTAAEKAAVRAMSERLHNADTLFVATPSARCAATSVKLESPVLEPEHGAAEEDQGHSDLDAEFLFSCERPNELHGMEVNLFDVFPNMRKIDVQMAGPRGQRAAALTPNQRYLSW